MATINITQGYAWTSGEVVTPAKMNQAAAPTAALAAGSIVNADISAAAAIAGSKIAPNFGSQNVVTTGAAGIGTATPHASAALEVASTTQGLLLPALTTAQRDAVAAPAAGLLVYNATTNKLNFYNGTDWESVTSA
jgi:hypothetical protein